MTYTNLPPGDYEFNVTACNNDGVCKKHRGKSQLYCASRLVSDGLVSSLMRSLGLGVYQVQLDLSPENESLRGGNEDSIR